MTIAALIIVFAGIILYEVPRLVREKMWGELMAFSGLMLLGMAFSFAVAMDIPLPNPTKGIEFIFSPVSDAVNKLLQ